MGTRFKVKKIRELLFIAFKIMAAGIRRQVKFDWAKLDLRNSKDVSVGHRFKQIYTDSVESGADEFGKFFNFSRKSG